MADFNVGRAVIDVVMDPSQALSGIGKIQAAAGLAGAAIAAMPALLSAGAGIGGVLKSSFDGVSDAMKAYETSQKGAAKAAATSAREAVQNARQIRDAEKGVADARRAAAKAAEDGAKRVSDAQKRERAAQEDLNDARRDALENLQELKRATEDFALDEEGAQIRVERAMERLRNVQADHLHSVLDVRDAEHDLAEARDSQADMMRDHTEAQKKLNEAEKKGVEGSKQVVDATEKVRDAQQGVKDAQQASAEAQQAAAERVAQATEKLADAQQDQALKAKEAAAGTNEYQDALNNLLPSQRDLVAQLIVMKPLMDGLKAAGADAFLPGVTQMLKDSTGLFPILNDFLRDTGTIMGDTARDLGKLFKSDEFKNNLDAMLQASLPIVQAFGDALVKFIDMFVDFGAKTAPVAQGIADGLGSIMDGLGGLFDALAPHMDAFAEIWRSLGGIIGALLPVLGEFMGAFGEVLARLLPPLQTLIETLAPAVTQFLQVMQPFWDALADVIGQVAVAFVQAIVPAIMAFLDAIKPLIPILVEVVKTIGNGLIKVIETLAPLLPPLMKTFADLILAIAPIVPLLADFAIQIIDALLPVLPPLVDAIIELVRDAVLPLIPPLLDIIKNLMPGMIWIIQQVVPIIVWLVGVLKDVLVWTIQNLVVPFLKLIADTLTWLNQFWQDAGQKVADVWKWIGDTLSAGWAWMKDNVFDPLVNFVTKTLPDSFATAAEWVGKRWEDIKQAVRAPIQWVIDFVYNDGIVAMWNGFADFVGLGEQKLARFELPPFAKGGPVMQPTIGLMGEAGPEYVLSAPAIRAMGGISAADDLHKSLLSGNTYGTTTDEKGAGPGGLSSFGQTWQQLWGIIKNAFPSARLTSSMRSGPGGSYHNKGQAIDVAGPRPGDTAFMGLMNRWIASHYPNSTELIYTPGINLRNGAPFMYSPAVRADHYDHVHWAQVPGGSVGVGNLGSGSAAAQGGFDPLGMVGDWFGDMIDMSGIPGGGKIVDLATGLGKKMFTSIKDYAVSTVTGLFGSDAAPAPGPVQDMVRSVAARYGWGGGSQWDALVRLVQKESSWNPNAQNPTSTAYGLFQFLNSTWSAMGGSKTSDPGMQAVWGLKYISQRYGDPLSALAFHNRNNWYDQGGVLPPGVNLAVNGTGQDEFIFRKDQLQSGLTINGDVYVTANSTSELVAELRQVGRKGPRTKAGSR